MRAFDLAALRVLSLCDAAREPVSRRDARSWNGVNLHHRRDGVKVLSEFRPAPLVLEGSGAWRGEGEKFRPAGDDAPKVSEPSAAGDRLSRAHVGGCPEAKMPHAPEACSSRHDDGDAFVPARGLRLE